MSVLILASASASRRAMLDAAGVAHKAIASSVDEDAIKASRRGDGPLALAAALAEAKARDVSAKHPDQLVLGGDSIVSVTGRMFDKPKNRPDATAHLRSFSGEVITLTSAGTLMKGGVIKAAVVDEARLHVRHLSDAFIEEYLEAEWPAISGCVGCFRIEARGVQLFDRIEGEHFTILGMPLIPLLGAFRAEGLLTS